MQVVVTLMAGASGKVYECLLSPENAERVQNGR